MFRRKPPAPLLPPRWLIVGLGNPGAEYAGTRHNVGYDVIDLLSRTRKIKLGTRKHRAVYGIGEVAGTVVILAKPLTFMNLSGMAIAPLAREYGIAVERIAVVADDLDLDVGRTRMKPKGGAGGHNGHKSLISALGSDQYPRLRIGIGKGVPGDTIDHVLSRFNPEDRDLINEAVERAAEGIELLVSDGLNRALTFVNSPRNADDTDDSNG